MGYKLEKPHTISQRANFICENQGFNYYEDDNCIIMYLDSEKVEDGIVVDISNTPEYIAEQESKAKAMCKDEITKEIESLDIKRIRAIAEPSQKNISTTWLEYYTEQIQELRNQLNALSN